jgi:hypothetical protein
MQLQFLSFPADANLQNGNITWQVFTEKFAGKAKITTKHPHNKPYQFFNLSRKRAPPDVKPY